MYTADQELALEQAPKPITFEAAQQFARDFGKTPRSVISKVKNLGLEYTPRVLLPKRIATKADLIAAISAKVPEGTDLAGLEKATTASLANLVKAL
jgi:hypothetical protein